MRLAAILSGHYGARNGTQTLQVCQKCCTSSPRLSHLDFGELGKDNDAEMVVPPGGFEFSPHRAVAGLQSGDVQTQFAYRNQTFRAVPLAVAALAFIDTRPSIECSWFSSPQWLRTTSLHLSGVKEWLSKQ